MSNNSDDIYKQSVDYHKKKPYGKIAVNATKSLGHQRDLSLAYSPGVAEPCRLIEKDPLQADYMTAKGNLIAVVSNGTAVLGLGDIGPLASKPVMEGKAVLFKKFSNINAFDIEVNEKDPDKLIDIVEALEPTFGGINLEDIKAPECFYIEKELSKRLNIPVFHDDQHGTAIIVAAAVLNGLKLVNKDIGKVKLICSGAGAAAIACIDLLVSLGLKPENVILSDSKGIVYKDRSESMDEKKAFYATSSKARSLKEAMTGSDIFLGVSVGGVVNQDMVKAMASKPLVLALANPEPEIRPELVKEVRDDAIIATGRTDYPNQVNNVLCFPYIFRGALDVGATCINEAMKIACVKAIADLAQAEVSDEVVQAYGGEIPTFGPEYIIPKPFDNRLFVELSAAVAKAAMDSGVARRPIPDFEVYRQELVQNMDQSSFVMRHVYARAKKPDAKKMRIAFCEGEETRILQAAQAMVNEGIGYPILIGRPDVIQWRMENLGLRMEEGTDFDIVNPNKDDRFHQYATAYYDRMSRKGISPETAKYMLRTNTTVIGAMMQRLGDADATLCGVLGRYNKHFKHVKQILGVDECVTKASSLCGVLFEEGPLFMCDPYVNEDPTAEQLAEMTMLSAQKLKQLGIKPKAALLSYSNFGSSRKESPLKMKKTLAMIQDLMPDLEIEGEMHADAALDENIRNTIFPDSTLSGRANLLIMPNLDAANIAYTMATSIGNAQNLGPFLMGIKGTAHILRPSSTVRDIVNMATLSVVEAATRKKNA